MVCAEQRWLSLLGNLGFSALNNADSALINSESTLILTQVDENNKLW